jgi:N-acetylglucosamine-6-phosphate deacetylase
MIITAARAVIEDQERRDIWLDIRDGLIHEIGDGPHPSAERKFPGTLIPGFVDIHCHGGGGYYFSNLNADQIRIAIDIHRKAGTTTQYASLVTADLEQLKAQIEALIPFVQSGELAGIHLEGPYLSRAKCGAHAPELLRAPHLEEIKTVIGWGQGSIAMVTIAPELEGALESIAWLASQGIIAAIGHTDADADTARAAIDAGAQVVTHFTNAMAKMVGGQSMATEVLEDSEISLELINDGTHVPVNVIEILKNSALGRTILVTDAMSAAGGDDGKYLIGDLAVEVKDSVARLVSNGALAGSTLTMERAFINFIFKDDVDIVDAVHASSTRAAQIFGLKNVGSLTVGKKANILHFDGKKIELITF